MDTVEPKWALLPQPPEWDGTPPVANRMRQTILWFLAPAHNKQRPFLARWEMFPGDKPDCWTSYEGGDFTPANVIAGGWKILATLGETTDMSGVCIDKLKSEGVGAAEIEALCNDPNWLDHVAIQIGIATGRISRAMAVDCAHVNGPKR